MTLDTYKMLLVSDISLTLPSPVAGPGLTNDKWEGLDLHIRIFWPDLDVSELVPRALPALRSAATCASDTARPSSHLSSINSFLEEWAASVRPVQTLPGADNSLYDSLVTAYQGWQQRMSWTGGYPHQLLIEKIENDLETLPCTLCDQI